MEFIGDVIYGALIAFGVITFGVIGLLILTTFFALVGGFLRALVWLVYPVLEWSEEAVGVVEKVVHRVTGGRHGKA